MDHNPRQDELLSAIAERGFAILPSFLTASDLALLRQDCGRVVASSSSSFLSSCIYEPVSTLTLATTSSFGSDSTAYATARGNDNVLSLLLGHQGSGKRLLKLVRWILGENVFVLNEQYIVKPGSKSNVNQNVTNKKRKRRCTSRRESTDDEEEDDRDAISDGTARTAFEWHRDADYLRKAGCTRPEAFVSVWITLDEVSSSNGTLIFSPLDAPNERVVVEEAAGTVVLIASEVLHRSSANVSGSSRRVWMPQYSARPQYWESEIRKEMEMETEMETEKKLVALGLPCEGRMMKKQERVVDVALEVL